MPNKRVTRTRTNVRAPMPMRRPMWDTAGLLAGAGAGILLMYLFDPRSGAERRKMIRETAMFASKNLASTAMHKGQEMYQSARDRAKGAVEWAGESMDDAKHRMNIALGREREHHYVGQSACAMGSMALGAGVMWLFDAQLGRERRRRIWNGAWNAMWGVGE